jgi:hypothetical protein
MLFARTRKNPHFKALIKELILSKSCPTIQDESNLTNGSYKLEDPSCCKNVQLSHQIREI